MAKTMQQYDVIFRTDLALIGLRFHGEKLANIKYLDEKAYKATPEKSLSKTAKAVKNKVEKYIDPSSKIMSINIDVLLNVSAFQGKVLEQLLKIPYGETRTYGEIAKILETSPRAVGNACRNNPLPIIIPCHRVVAANGIGGYDGAKSGDLLAIKYSLLEMEGVCLEAEEYMTAFCQEETYRKKLYIHR